MFKFAVCLVLGSAFVTFFSMTADPQVIGRTYGTVLADRWSEIKPIR